MENLQNLHNLRHLPINMVLILVEFGISRKILGLLLAMLDQLLGNFIYLKPQRDNGSLLYLVFKRIYQLVFESINSTPDCLCIFFYCFLLLI